MNSFDWLLTILVALQVAAGFRHGFARTGIGFAAMILGVMCGLWMYSMPAGVLVEYLHSQTGANVLGFFIIFIAVNLLGGVVSHILARVFRWAGLTWLDRLVGAAFGLLKGTVLAVAIATVVTAFAPAPTPKFIVNSQVLPYVAVAGEVLAAAAPYELKTGYNETMARVNDLWRDVKIEKRRVREKD